MTESFVGRQWLISKKDLNINENYEANSSIKDGHCARCHSDNLASLPSGNRYCRNCIGLGRVSEDLLLVHSTEEAHFEKLPNGGMTWQGTLTDRQAKISKQLLENFHKKQSTLVHAVTGAGKTEMLFQLIQAAMAKGQRAAIATPRIDVVNELYPRFCEAFSEVQIGIYHGKIAHEAHFDQLIICTTHQLLKYYHAFDLIIIDEVDSFPFVNDESLHFGSKQALKLDGVMMYLTATPPAYLLKENLEILTLNRRFHGGLLPVPQCQLLIKPFLKEQQLHPKILADLKMCLEKGHPVLLFIPRIAEIPAYTKAVSQLKVKFASVHAEDPERLEKVQAFRDGKLDLLLTTTILERGVTFKHVWVLIVQADDQIYTSSSLVQIAGRVGRDKVDNNGLVKFYYHKYTKAIDQAIRDIKRMNR
ncbi:MAG: helicase-related protein [Lactobacillus sp.]|nr:helicase-related protein [Lactobacillus sp.]